MRVMPYTEELPNALYRAEQVREFDRIAIEEYGISGSELMERAGSRAFQLIRELWPEVADLSVVCGAGNNGGDGYVVARLARQAGLACRVFWLVDPARLQGDARRMADAWHACGGESEPLQQLPRQTDLIVDALLGTGLVRPISGEWAVAVRQINVHPAPVLAIDIPSGLDSDTGCMRGTAVQADATLSFIGLKQGMFTADGPGVCGKIRFDALELPAQIYARQILAARRLDYSKIVQHLTPRPRTAHKGDFGRLLVIGGDQGYSGAARMAAEAAARGGAGLVAVATHPAHAATLNIGRPELMCHGVAEPDELEALLEWADQLVLGPGLGQGEWGRAMFAAACSAGLPMVADADALNLLAAQPERRANWVLTPHPGEAARLLGSDVGSVQRDRFQALQDLSLRYGGVVILKGPGSLIGDDSSRRPGLCSAGNPGLASGGSGDILSGLLGALLAQGLAAQDAAETAVCVHAAAADRAAEAGERGMLVSDLLPHIRRLLNPESADVGA